MRFFHIVNTSICLITFPGLIQACSLLRRARYDGFGRPAIGPPNGPARCNEAYGAPKHDDCFYATEWITGVHIAADGDVDAVQRVADTFLNTIVEFRSPVADRQDRQPQRPAVRTPKYWRYGECVVSVTVLEGARCQPSDDAAWRDISESSNWIQETCVGALGLGGKRLIGEHNNLAVEVFTPNSPHGEAVEVDLGHEIAAFLDRAIGPAQPNYIDDSEDEDEDDEDTFRFGGESAGWTLSYKSCSAGTKFVLRKLGNLPVLLGVDALSAISSAIGTCSSTKR
ncbi:MAG: hypothetical protein M1836_001617 [Candelina mexicana]|nr:MAG: hypothetical protein M1836_001617 [Candelina mexicana]